MTVNLTRVAQKLTSWSRRKYGDAAKELRECRQTMGRLMEEEQSAEVIAEMRNVDARMNEIESREEVYWKQRSRQE